MPTGETGKRGKRSPPPSGGDSDGDRIGDLPDGILHHILGFLPAPEAVQTCVLARRWRHLWKSATGLRITNLDGEELVPMDELKDFVHHLLLLRGNSPLDTCELRLEELEHCDCRSMRLWFRHAVLCQVQELRLNVTGTSVYFELDNLPLVSRHLAKLEITGVSLVHSFLDFSSCLVLEHLELFSCDLSDAERISSQSLKHLNIADCYFSESFRTRIYVPNLLSLRLHNYSFRTPVFEVMPLLVEAFVRVDNISGDYATCASDNPDFKECPRDECDLCHSSTIVLLQAFSQAKNLVLIAHDQEYVFKRDLMRCPTFSNLKTLYLIDYSCVAFDLHGITCILRHSPVLEKLILGFASEESKQLEMKGSYSQSERSSEISGHLKLVVVKCGEIEERVIKVLQFLSTFNIRFSFV